MDTLFTTINCVFLFIIALYPNKNELHKFKTKNKDEMSLTCFVFIIFIICGLRVIEIK